MNNETFDPNWQESLELPGELYPEVEYQQDKAYIEALFLISLLDAVSNYLQNNLTKKNSN